MGDCAAACAQSSVCGCRSVRTNWIAPSPPVVVVPFPTLGGALGKGVEVALDGGGRAAAAGAEVDKDVRAEGTAAQVRAEQAGD